MTTRPTDRSFRPPWQFEQFQQKSRPFESHDVNVTKDTTMPTQRLQITAVNSSGTRDGMSTAPRSRIGIASSRLTGGDLLTPTT
jgi:hypothetical protein